MNHQYLNARILRVFVAVAKNESFTQAALELHCRQANVSQQIKQLEEMLEVKLFEKRNGKSIPKAKTPAGCWLLKRAPTMIKLPDKLFNSLARFREQKRIFAEHISLMSIDTVWSRCWLDERRSQALKESFECLKANELNVPIGSSVEIERRVASGQVDFGFVVLPVETKGVRHLLLHKQAFVAVLPTKFSQFKRGKLNFKAIANERWFTCGERTRDCIADRMKAIKPASEIFLTENVEASIVAVRRQNGIAVIPEGCEDSADDLICIPIPRLQRKVALIWTKTPTKAHEAFLEYVKKNREFTED